MSYIQVGKHEHIQPLGGGRLRERQRQRWRQRETEGERGPVTTVFMHAHSIVSDYLQPHRL